MIGREPAFSEPKKIPPFFAIRKPFSHSQSIKSSPYFSQDINEPKILDPVKPQKMSALEQNILAQKNQNLDHHVSPALFTRPKGLTKSAPSNL